MRMAQLVLAQCFWAIVKPTNGENAIVVGPTFSQHVGPSWRQLAKWRCANVNVLRWANIISYRWANVVGERWANVVGERWANILPTYLFSWHNVGITYHQCWPNVKSLRWANIKTISKMTLGQRQNLTMDLWIMKRWANVGPTLSCYLGRCSLL